jgi:uncharacterized protein YndB with AHSA1/START domain
MEKHTLRLNEIIISTVDKAFDAFTDPVHLSRWFTTEAKADLKVGGRYSNADGDRGQYLATDRPHKVKFTWDNEKHCPGTVVEVTFEAEAEDGVGIELRHSELSSDDHVRDMETGWSWALASLKSYLETGKPVQFEDWQKNRPKNQ